MSCRSLPVRFAAVLVAFLPALAVLPEDGRAAGPPPRPDIVLVLTDDQRWDTLYAMPAVRRELVQQGVTFTNAFAVNPLCCPSRASILTGRYSHSTGVYSNTVPYGGASWFDDSSTLATWLGAVGYRTGFVGKYLNGYPGTWLPRGWHHWFGYDGGFFDWSANVNGIRTGFGADEASYSTDVFAREAVSFIHSSSQPFFLVYAPYAPHAPATPAPRHTGLFSDAEPWRPKSFDEEDVSDKPAWMRAKVGLTEVQKHALDTFRKRQLESLRAVDDGVAAIVEALRSSGRLGTTIIVFASDNGLLWGEHRMIDRKVAAFEESIRIPFVVRYDALVGAPRSESRIVANVDLAPTFAGLAGAKAPGVEGRSLVPLLQRSVPVRWRTKLLVEHLRIAAGGNADVPTYCAVRGTRYKYVVYATREEEFYDLATDPHELVNRAADPAFRGRLLSFRLDVKSLCTPPPPGFNLAWLCTLEGDGETTVLRGTARADTICGHGSGERIFGGRGADVLRAGGGADTVYGEAGADQIAGGAGRDTLAAGPGDDILLARDGARDRVVCGSGRHDVAVVDRGDAVARDCETVNRPPRRKPPRG